MFECKFCHKIKSKEEESSSHSKLCNECNNLLYACKRAMMQSSVTIEQQLVIKRVSKMVEENKRRGGYVPKFYTQRSAKHRCEYCGCEFISRVKTSKCEECRKREATYRALLHYADKAKKPSKRLIELEDFYATQLALGFKAPKLYLERREAL